MILTGQFLAVGSPSRWRCYYRSESKGEALGHSDDLAFTLA